MRVQMPLTVFSKRSFPVIFGVAVLCWALLPGSEAQPSNATTSASLVHIAADKQTFDEKTGASRFIGNVDVAYKNVQIKSTEATVQVGAEGNPGVVTFLHRPKAIRTIPGKGMDNLEADTIQIRVEDDVMQANGNVVTYVATAAENPFTIRSDAQQFDNPARRVNANGNVQVNYKGVLIKSPMATLMMGDSGKAERVKFTGGAMMEKDGSVIHANQITVMVDSGNLISEGNVNTLVDGGSPAAGGNGKITIKSDYQQYDKASETMLTSGHVQIHYEDYFAQGPKATFKLKGGQVDKVFLTGRSNIKDTERLITADKITILTNPKSFDAVGNVKTQFKTASGASGAKPTPAATAAKPAAKSGAKGKPTATAAKGQPKPGSKPGVGVLTEEEEEFLGHQ